jgi:hypothetical protein
MLVEVLADSRNTTVRATDRTVSLSVAKAPLRFRVRVTTDAAPLTPISREKIFRREFLEFLQRRPAAGDTAARTRAHRLERQARGVELLSSEEKLMAGLPNFATYFGRDMMMTALMMRPIWTPEMSEHVIASVLRKLGRRGEVSHEEALGGQAIREHAVIYDSLIRANQKDKAKGVLRDLQKTRENYHMIDDEFQLPVLAAGYLADTTIPAERKRAFLRTEINGSSSLQLLLRELGLVVSLAEPYVRRQEPLNLVGFPRLDAKRWRSASWRDSDAGYAQGRFAMDINVIWVPRALESISHIIAALGKLNISPQALDTVAAEIRNTALGEYLRDPASLDRAIEIWKSARRHFMVTMDPAELQRRLQAKLAWLPSAERRYWQAVIKRQKLLGVVPLSFLALSLDSTGHPIPIPNTDPATELFLYDSLSAGDMQADLAPMLRHYPAGLFVEGLGPLVANDAYASRAVWERFQADQYHGPRVVWGREVNLLLLGLANRLMKERNPELQDALRRILDAVHASGLQHNELWSYQIRGNRLLPVRYGTSSDVQLWNTTNLVVQYVLSRVSP